MSEHRSNVRSSRTRQQLRDALLQLAEDRNIRDIDIRDITRQARLNRTTFYHHYPDKDALAEDVISQLFADLSEGGRALLDGSNPASLRSGPAWHDTLFTRIAAHPRLYGRLLEVSDQRGLSRQLLDFHEQLLLDLWSRLGYAEPEDGPPAEIVARVAAAGVQGMLRLWLERGMPQSPEVLSTWSWNMCFPKHVIKASRGEALSEPSSPISTNGYS